MSLLNKRIQIIQIFTIFKTFNFAFNYQSSRSYYYNYFKQVIMETHHSVLPTCSLFAIYESKLQSLSGSASLKKSCPSHFLEYSPFLTLHSVIIIFHSAHCIHHSFITECEMNSFAQSILCLYFDHFQLLSDLVQVL